MAFVEDMAPGGRVLVVRHAQSAWNAAGRWQGWSDAPLSELGRAQAGQAGKALVAMGVNPGIIASSDLGRARRTAELIAAELGWGGRLLIDPDFREQDLGEWNGLTTPEIASLWPAELEARRQGSFGPVPGGEAAAHFTARAVRAVRRVASLVVASKGEAVIVSHGGVVMALEQELGTWSPDNRHTNLSGWWVAASGPPGDVELRALNRADLLITGAGMVTGRG